MESSVDCSQCRLSRLNGVREILANNELDVSPCLEKKTH